ncbi:MAG: hypothetical protein C5B49_10145 [Bdellovibrio sp.]|nr:MAG: hypothetical protein C5B49_10145 [Bdellovibrio sp.]
MRGILRRRDFLKSLGAGSILLPTLPSLLLKPESAFSAAGKPPIRVAFIWGFNGVVDSVFWPAAAPTNQVAPGVYATPLSSIQGSISPIINSSFDAVRPKFSLIRGLGLPLSPYGADNIVHEAVSVLALSLINSNDDSEGFDGPHVGSTMDNIFQYSSSFYPTVPTLAALRIAGGDPKWSVSFWRPNGGTQPPYNQVQTNQFSSDNPSKVFSSLFPNIASSGSTAKATPTPSAQAAYRTQVFNSLLADFTNLSKSPALSSSDQQRLQSHADMLSNLQTRLTASATGTTLGSSGAGCKPTSPASGSNVAQKYDANFASIAMAFACDTTRLAFYTIDNFDDNGSVSWDDDHNNSHSDFSQTSVQNNCANWRGWQATRVANFLKQLDSITDIDGTSTLLDNTIVIWVNQHGGCHNITNYPVLIGGKAGGQFNTGNYYDYRLRTKGTPGDRSVGYPLTSLWMAIMRAAGIPASEYLVQGESNAYGQDITKDDFTSQYGPNLATMRQQLLPYFYTGPA